MIYLIGGSSHVGKTLLAQKLLEKTKIPYTSLDHLKMGLIRSKMLELTPYDDDEIRYRMWPFVAEMIKTAIENNQSFILEGCYIPLEWQESFSKSELENIKCLFIVMSESYIRDHFSDIVDYANVIEKRLDDHPDMDRLISCSKYFKEGCREHGIPFYEIDKIFDINDLVRHLQA